ncbi:MAG: hypothetical protein HOP95_05415 [Sphingomonas sp.]|nr:hypothetical protein [Sphingomonas sp.]
MRPSLRFLLLAVFGWAGLRAATLGSLPGAELFRIDPSEAKPPPLIPTQFPAIEPIPAGDPASGGMVQPQTIYGQPPAFAPAPRTIGVPVYLAAQPQAAAATPLVDSLREPRPQFYSPVPVLDEWPLSRLAAMSFPAQQSTVVTPAQSLPAELKRNGIDRIQLTAWALLRAQSAGIAGTQPLASGGSLGASQAGARLTYNFTRQIAASFRTSSDVGRRGGEVAAGVRVQPIAGIPLWIDAERRQRVGKFGGGRSAFALFFEAGVYGRPMPLHFLLDSYVQGGVVGVRSRDKFIDGALTLTRPVYKQFSAGFGIWGGAQPGVYRVDAGPRITMKVRNNLRVHFDWRQRLAGKALPGSGPAVTLAGDF